MRSITRLFSALNTLADSIVDLASLVNNAAAKLRLQLAEQSEPAPLPHNSEVLDDAGPQVNGSTKRPHKTAR